MTVHVVIQGDSSALARAAEELRRTLAGDSRLTVHASVDGPGAASSTAATMGADLDAARIAIDDAHQDYNRLSPQSALSRATDAETHLRRWLDRSDVPPLLARALRLKGLTLLYLERNDEAKVAFAAASALDPSFGPGAEEWPPEARLLYADTVAETKRRAPGSLSVRVTPEAATVWLDGRNVGNGSTTVAKVAPGVHYLLVVCPAHERFAGVVTVDGGGKLSQASVFLNSIDGASGRGAAVAALDEAWNSEREKTVARQIAAVLQADAVVMVSPNPHRSTDPPVAWILGSDGERRGGFVTLASSAAGAAEIIGRLFGITDIAPVEPTTPWYARWTTWVIAGGAAAVVGGSILIYAMTRDKPDRLNFYTGPKQ
ncbi:MAG: PEGA domain-containing protein [Myxococcota bacterium]